MAALLLLIFIPRLFFEKSQNVPDYDFELVEKLPHDPQAFTQGFLYRDGFFYESTGQYGTSTVRKVDPQTGVVLERRDLHRRFFGEGLAFFKGALFQLTWRAGQGFVYNSDTLQSLSEFRYKSPGWGLTTDGERLIMSDGSHKLYFREPGSFTVTKTIGVFDGGKPVKGLNELEYINGEIWANVYQTFRIVRISPETGAVLSRIDLSGILSKSDSHGNEDALNGIAFDEENKRIFVTGKNYAYVYQIQLIPKA